MKDQMAFIKKKLLHEGKVSRNWALSNYISRLGAYVCDLNAEGWVIEGHFVKTANGRDYLYSLISSPMKKVVYTVPTLGLEIKAFE